MAVMKKLRMMKWLLWIRCGNILSTFYEAKIVNQEIVDKEYVWQKNQWCPSGLTRSQKRRVQCLTNDELRQKRHKVWQVKQTVDKNKGKALAGISAIFMLPAQFRASNEVESDEEVVVAQWICQAESATFEKPEKHLHLKALYLKGFIDGKSLTKMLVDGGAAVNLMPYSTLRKLGRRTKKLCPTDMRLIDFSGNISVTKGAICDRRRFFEEIDCLLDR